MSHDSKPLGARIADKNDSLRDAANPAAAEMIAHLDSQGIETVLDRLDAQGTQCSFGLRGLCCRMCQWGPCRISEKSPRGVCGRTIELVVMANLLRAAAAGASAQTMHAREMLLTLRAVGRGEISLSVQSTQRLRDVGNALNATMSWTPMEEVPELIAQALLDDLSRLTEGPMKSMGFAPQERRRIWNKLDLSPRSAAFEIIEALHMTTLGGCSDPSVLFAQAVRTSLAQAYAALVSSSVLSDILFGIPEPVVAEVNYGILKPDHVNILVHGHSAVMLEKLLEKVASKEIQDLARDRGAAGIVVGGMCCTGHESLARHGIPTVTGAMGQELAIGTGAVDAVVVDMQCVLPGMQAVAECFGTDIVTTCRSNRIPGATHVEFDPEHPQTLDEDAMRVARLAVESFATRDHSKIHIPTQTTAVMAGFTRESVMSSFGSARKLNALMASGSIRGVVAMVGCSTPKIAYETGHVTIARELIANDVLVLTSGCSAHALMGAGLCSTDAAEMAGPGLRAACKEAGVPPVLAIGSCSDNTRVIQIFAQLAHNVADIPEMPFVLSGPELANEKTIGQLLAVLAHGVTCVVGLTPQLPISSACTEAEEDTAMNPIEEFFSGEGLMSMLGARLHVQPNPQEAAQTILRVLNEKRQSLFEDGAGESE